MPAPSERPLRRVNVRIFESTFHSLVRMATDTTGFNKIVRTVLEAYVRQVEDEARRKIDEIERQSRNPMTEESHP